MKFSSLMDSFETNVFSVIDESKYKMLKEGREVINLSVGSPDLSPDKHVVDALRDAALDMQNWRYSLADMPELISAAQDWYKRRYGVQLSGDEITSAHGSQEGLSHISFPLCNRGDVVLAPDPGYPIFSFGPFLAGAKIVTYPLVKENDFLIDFDKIDANVAHQAKVIVVSYPTNPLTAIAPPEFYEKLISFAKKYDIIVVHDNAYSELVMDGPPTGSFLAYKDAKEVGIEFNSLSKSYNMSGARISFALGNKEIISKYKTLKSQIDYGVFYPVQMAAIAALNGPQDILDRNRAEYRKRRDVFCGGLRSIGWDAPDTSATMFMWAPLPEGYDNSMDFTLELMEKTGVLCVPGSSFGDLGEGYVRFALVESEKTLQRAVDLIGKSGIVK